MKVSSINKFFARFGEFQIRNRRWFLMILVLVSAFCMAGLPRLRLENNEDEWLDNGEQVRIDQNRFEDIFGNDDSVMVLVQADDVFDPEVLDAIDRLGKRLEMEVPFADEVTSLTTAEIARGVDDGLEVSNPFEDGIPADPVELAEKKAFILSRDSLVDNLVSSDAKETWIILSLEPYEDGKMEEGMMKVGEVAQKIILSEEFKSAKYTFKPTGMGYTEYEENQTIGKECAIRILSGFVVMLLCLILFVRSLRGFIVPIVATVCGIASVFGATGWLNITGQLMVVVLPVLLSMALSVGYSIHYINSFKMHFRKTGKRRDSVIVSIEESGWPIFFTVVTTVASLLSFLVGGMGPVRWVGAVSAACVFAVYLYVIILIPIFMSYGKDGEPSAADTAGATRSDLWFERFGTHILKRSAVVIAVSAVIVAVMVPGLFKIKVNMDYTEMMGKKIPYIARLIDIIHAKLGCQYTYDVMIEEPEIDAFKEPEKMLAIDELCRRLGTLELTKISGDTPRVTSVTRLVKEMNRALNSDDKDFYVVPEEQDLLTQLMFLYEISGGDDFTNWIDEDYRTTHIHIEMKGFDATQIVSDIAAARRWGAELFPGAHVSIVGEAIQYAEMNKKLTVGELKSFAGSFIIIAILLILSFSSIRTGLIGMIPNLAPVVLIGGVMGYLHYSLDMVTMMVMPMILGIAVDDTIHLTNHIKYGLEKTGSYTEAVRLSFREIGKTMGMTTFILCSMFFMITFSPMNTLFRIGVLSIIGLGSALVADYTLTPVLIVLTKPFGKQKSLSNGKSTEV